MRPHDGLVNLQVRRRTTQALDVDTPLLGIQAECLERSGLAQQLDGIDVLVSAVVTGARVALGVFVGHGRAQGVEHRAGSHILGGDQDDGFALALDLFFLEVGTELD